MKPGLTQWLRLGTCMLCLVALGCTDGYEEPEFETVVTGKLTKGGAPLTVDKAQFGDYARVELTFVPVEGEGDTLDAQVEEDGSFTVQLAEGKKPSGKYRVVVYQYSDSENDALEGKFGEENSPIEVAITPGQPLDIDLDNP